MDSRYSVSVPANLTLDFLSYPCDSVVAAGNRMIYHFFKTNFMPERDIVFSWTGPSGQKPPAVAPAEKITRYFPFSRPGF
jgi:hypothetical protein